MPFCTQCGNAVRDTDIYCGTCGTKQSAGPSGGGSGSQIASGLSPRTAALLCYIPIVGWIASIVVLAAAKFRTDRDVRFHAFQGLYLFVAWLIVDWVVAPFFTFVPRHMLPVGSILKLAIIGTWIFMLVKTAQEQMFRLPIIGELAERSVAEQK